MRAAHRRARAQHTFPWLPQHWSHQDLTEGLGVLGAEGGEGSHEVAGGRLREGQDLWREKKSEVGTAGKETGENRAETILETSAQALTRLRKSCSARTAALA